MKIPKGLSEEETIDKINLVVQRISPRYTFASYDVDDIKQEAFIICYNALERYDPKVGPLENFLSINLSNRLKNFIRDNHYKKDDEQKKKIMSPSPLYTITLIHLTQWIKLFFLKRSLLLLIKSYLLT